MSGSPLDSEEPSEPGGHVEPTDSGDSAGPVDGSEPVPERDPGEPAQQEQSMAEALREGIGGPRGMFDSSLPTAVFLVIYLVGDDLGLALRSAIGAGAVIAVFRAVRRRPVRQIITGFVGLGIAAAFAARTGRAEDFFLPGLLINAAYGTALAVSALISRPLLGYVAATVAGLSGWRQDRRLLRAALLSTWIWAGLFGLRLAVQVPLWAAGAVGALGSAKIVMGWPLFLLAGFLSYRIMLAPIQDHRQRAEAEAGTADTAGTGTQIEAHGARSELTGQ